MSEEQQSARTEQSPSPVVQSINSDPAAAAVTTMRLLVDGEALSGRTSLIEKVLIPAIHALGITINRDMTLEHVLNIEVPPGHLAAMEETAGVMAAVFPGQSGEELPLAIGDAVTLRGLNGPRMNVRAAAGEDREDVVCSWHSMDGYLQSGNFRPEQLQRVPA